jgi:hypothetical protein
MVISDVDKWNDNALLLFIGIPLALLTVVVIFAAIYAHRKRKQYIHTLELPRSQRTSSIVLVSEATPPVSQKQKLTIPV